MSARPARGVSGLPETAVAMVYGGSTQAVMMATPADLEDFAVGFSLTEGIVTDPAQIERLEVLAHPRGVEAQMADRG